MLNTVSGRPIWTAINKSPKKYPWLSKNESCEVVIVGGGLTGAMCALQFAEEGIDVILLEGGSIGSGYTSSFPGILSVEFDKTLSELTKKYSNDQAFQIYDMFHSALNNVQDICENLSDDVSFERKDIFRFSADENYINDFNEEYLVRKHNGFPVDFLESKEAGDKFSFKVSSGIYSYNQAAELDPYLFAYAMIKAAENHKCKIYENSSVDAITRENGEITVRTKTGFAVAAKKLIIASGLESIGFETNIDAHQATAFSLATIPVEEFSGWHKKCVLYCNDTHRYFVRTLKDNRILISGLESVFIDAIGKVGGFINIPQLLNKKYNELESILASLFPAIRNIRPEYAYASSYEISSDGFPIIGEHPDHENVYFALCGGNNGIIFAEIASRVILTLYSGREPVYPDQFKPNRNV